MMVLVDEPEIRIERLTLGPWGTNTYIVVSPPSRESLVVDAPAEAGNIIDALRNTTPRYILLTHDHFDHTGALDELRERLQVPLAAHPADTARIAPPPEIMLADGDEITLGDINFRVLHTPGHTPGGLCFLTGRHLIGGDTIFPGGPGKTATPGAFRQIIESITGKILNLPDDTVIYTGHGEATTVKQAREEYNAFSSRPHDNDLCGDVLWLGS